MTIAVPSFLIIGPDGYGYCANRAVALANTAMASAMTPGYFTAAAFLFTFVIEDISRISVLIGQFAKSNPRTLPVARVSQVHSGSDVESRFVCDTPAGSRIQLLNHKFRRPKADNAFFAGFVAQASACGFCFSLELEEFKIHRLKPVPLEPIPRSCPRETKAETLPFLQLPFSNSLDKLSVAAYLLYTS